MSVVLMGLASALDVLANAFVFSGQWRSSFDVGEAANFSTILGWAAVLASIFFGGAEQLVDHRKVLPSNRLGAPSIAAMGWGVLVVGAGVASLAIPLHGVMTALVLVPILGLRGVGRSLAYGRHRFWDELWCSFVEVIVLLALTATGFSIVTCYVCAKLVGLVPRIRHFVNAKHVRVPAADMWSYSFTAVAPAIYFNMCYVILPWLATADVAVRFRFLQTVLVPVSFLGSLLARSRVVLRGAASAGIFRLFGAFEGEFDRAAIMRAVLFPASIACVYVAAVSGAVVRLGLWEACLVAAYCVLIYQRAQLYSQITLRLGPRARARVGEISLMLLALALAAMLEIGMASVAALYLSLAGVELVLLVLCLALLRRDHQMAVS